MRFKVGFILFQDKSAFLFLPVKRQDRQVNRNPNRVINETGFHSLRVESRSFCLYICKTKTKGLMYEVSTPSLIRVSCIDKGERIGIDAYADLAVFDSEKTLVALRIGGYPESVQAMSEAIQGGCSLELQGKKEKFTVTTKGKRSYVRKLSHDGIYAEGMHYLKDDDPRSLMIGGENEKEESKTVALNRNLYFFCNGDDELFTELDQKLSVPLIPEFKDYFLSEIKKRNILKPLQVYCIGRRFQGWHMNVTDKETELVEVLEDGLKAGCITIPGASDEPSRDFDSILTFTQYLQEFGTMIADRIKDCFPPRYNPAEEPICPELDEVNQFVMDQAGYSLFDAQLGAAEALKRQLETDKMALLVAECGTGKTKIGSAALYAYQHSNPKRRVYDKAFNVIICPSHITGKWVRELHETIPNCFAKHIQTMTDVDNLYEYYKTHSKTVYCILSKETARNGYMRKPSVRWNPVRKGFECPHCGYIQEMTVFDGDTSYLVNADSTFFLNENSKNHKCQNSKCREPLWGMLNPTVLAPENTDWVRIGGYGFVHRRFAWQAHCICKSKENLAKIEEVMDNPNGIFPAPGAYSRYPLSAYIKRKIRRIDALLVDELHQYSGESAQGQAMAELAGIADKVLGMTATLINGYAKGIFYLLYRLKAHLMLEDNHRYNGSNEFCAQYGVVEELYELDTSQYNTTSKASKRKMREKFLPGISPIVYSRFLLENTVFLSLADMGKELPDYEEIPVFCDMTDKVREEYTRLETVFKKIMRKDAKLGNRIMSAFMNLLTAYPDQPYGHDPIYNPLIRHKKESVILPENIGDGTVLQPKDTEVMSLIESKIAAGERVIVYTAWTRLDTQEKLLKALAEKNIPSAILDQRVPTVKRETWVDKRLGEGVKVLIVNPALVETGLDLNAFTTLIFYNIAYNLYIFRQASRRSWRINQTAPKVEVYMFYYRNTMQQRALRLMASKLSAATVIEGNISDEGLAAMSACEDMTTQLAKELMLGIRENTETLADSFKKMAIHNERSKKQTPAPQGITVTASEATEPAPVTQPQPQPVTVTATHPAITIIETSGKKFDTGQLSIFDLLAS